MHNPNSLRCELCFEAYNLSDRLPRSIPQCGHSACSQCLSEMLRFSGQIRCPFDKQPLYNQKPSLNAFPIHTQLQNSITEALSWEVCQIHRREFEYICLNDQIKLCNDCVLFSNEHQAHNIQSLKDFYPQVNEQVGILQGGLYSLDSYYQEASHMLLERKVALLQIVSSRFEELTKMIRHREKQLSIELEAFFENQLKNLNQAYGNNSDLRRNLMEKISKCEGFPRNLQDSSLLEEEIEQVMKRTEYSLLKEKLDKTSNSLDEIFRSLDKSLITQLDVFNKLGEPSQVFNIDLKDLYSINNTMKFQSFNKGQSGFFGYEKKNEGALEIEMNMQTNMMLETIR